MKFSQFNGPEAMSKSGGMKELQAQENFDTECLAEAKKLKTNLEALQQDIFRFGGPEQFKEAFEVAAEYDDKEGNLAGKDISERNATEEILRSRAKKLATISKVAVAASYIVGTGIVTHAITTRGLDHMGEVMQRMHGQILPSNPTMEEVAIVICSAVFWTGVASGVKSIYDRIKARKLNRQQKIQELKFKITGTEIK